VIAATLLLAAAAHAERLTFTEVHMGVEVRIVICAQDRPAAAAAARESFDAIRAWDEALSDWNPASQAMQLPDQVGARAKVTGRLAVALDQSARWQSRTDGGFDPALGALTRLWRESARSGAWPEAASLEAARARCGWSGIEWDAPTSEFRVLRNGIRLDFGGLGQGLAADEALAVLARRGFRHAMVDISGDIALGSAPPGEPGWRVAVEPAMEGQPGCMLLLAECGVSCSGDRGQPRLLDGRRVSHILDPASGLPVRAPRQAVVVAADATRADALATALCVLPWERCGSLVATDAVRAARLTRGPSDGGLRTLGAWESLTPAPVDPVASPRPAEAAPPAKAPEAEGSRDPTSPDPR